MCDVLFNVTALILQVELLSLMSTADIRSIGADVLLTWGGRILTGITHPQVSLMTLTSGLDLTFNTIVPYKTKIWGFESVTVAKFSFLSVIYVSFFSLL